MGIVSNLNNQIYNLQSSVSSMYTQLGQKRDDVRRLKQARTELLGEQQEFHRRTNVLSRPELPSSPWRGVRADEFQAFRKGPFTSSYKSIATNQLDYTISRIDSEIMAIESSISILESQINSAHSSISDLRERKREELRKT